MIKHQSPMQTEISPSASYTDVRFYFSHWLQKYFDRLSIWVDHRGLKASLLP